MESNRHTIYRCAGRVRWIVEQRGVLLIDEKEGRHEMLEYPDAAVWDLLTRYRPGERFYRMLAAIDGTDFESAEKLVKTCLEKWCETGWLVREDKP